MFRVSDLCSFLVCLPLSSTNNIRPFGHHLEKDISELAKGGALTTDSKGIYDAMTRNLSSLHGRTDTTEHQREHTTGGV